MIDGRISHVRPRCPAAKGLTVNSVSLFLFAIYPRVSYHSGTMFRQFFLSMLAWLPHPSPLAKPHPDFPDPSCKSCGVSLNGWNHHRVPDDVHCCSRCWSRVPVAERLKYQIMLDDRAPDGPIGNLASLARGAIMRDEHADQ